MTSKFDFDTPLDRRGTGSLKWDIGENELPMWVADMDFATAPAVTDALQKRAGHGAFGYTMLGDDWYEAYQNWWQSRHRFAIQREWLLFATGVVPAISSIVRKVTTVGEKVVVLTPVYNIFFNSILNNGRFPLECPLRYENGAYSIDFADLEAKLSDPQASLLLFCNPHNPVGKIWGAETIARVGALCEKHHVLVLSDEIHCDIIAPDKEYTPFAAVNETCRQISITCVAPTKAFNLAGLQTAAVIVPDAVLRHRVNRGLNTDEVAEPNVFAAIAPAAAFGGGEAWLDALRKYLWKNRAIAEEFIACELPQLHAVKAEATYLMWLDCRALTLDSEALRDHIRKASGLFVSDGAEYHDGGGFLRINLACPRTRLIDGLNRLKHGIETF